MALVGAARVWARRLGARVPECGGLPFWPMIAECERGDGMADATRSEGGAASASEIRLGDGTIAAVDSFMRERVAAALRDMAEALCPRPPEELRRLEGKMRREAFLKVALDLQNETRLDPPPSRKS